MSKWTIEKDNKEEQNRPLWTWHQAFYLGLFWWLFLFFIYFFFCFIVKLKSRLCSTFTVQSVVLHPPHQARSRSCTTWWHLDWSLSSAVKTVCKFEEELTHSAEDKGHQGRRVWSSFHQLCALVSTVTSSEWVRSQVQLRSLNPQCLRGNWTEILHQRVTVRNSRCVCLCEATLFFCEAD